MHDRIRCIARSTKLAGTAHPTLSYRAVAPAWTADASATFLALVVYAAPRGRDSERTRGQAPAAHLALDLKMARSRSLSLSQRRGGPTAAVEGNQQCAHLDADHASLKRDYGSWPSGHAAAVVPSPPGSAYGASLDQLVTLLPMLQSPAGRPQGGPGRWVSPPMRIGEAANPGPIEDALPIETVAARLIGAGSAFDMEEDPFDFDTLDDAHYVDQGPPPEEPPPCDWSWTGSGAGDDAPGDAAMDCSDAHGVTSAVASQRDSACGDSASFHADVGFARACTFNGRRSGKVFKKGVLGLGYYDDVPLAFVSTPPAQAAPPTVPRAVPISLDALIPPAAALPLPPGGRPLALTLADLCAAGAADPTEQASSRDRDRPQETGMLLAAVFSAPAPPHAAPVSEAADGAMGDVATVPRPVKRPPRRTPPPDADPRQPAPLQAAVWLAEGSSAEAACGDFRHAGLWAVDSHNSNCWNSFRRYLASTAADAVLGQELKTAPGTDTAVAERSARSSGWSMAVEPAAVTPAGGRSAGVAAAVRSHHGLDDHPAAIGLDPLAHRFVLKWWGAYVRGGVALASVYLWVNEALSKRNMDLLDAVAFCLDRVRGPWILAGDFNMPPPRSQRPAGSAA